MAEICLKKDEAANLTAFPEPPRANIVDFRMAGLQVA
jgi:hypothetical protein